MRTKKIDVTRRRILRRLQAVSAAMLAEVLTLSTVTALAKALHGKYENVKALKVECRRVAEIADCVRVMCEDLEKDIERRADDEAPPIGKALKFLFAGLTEAGVVLDLCTSEPFRAKVFSQMNIDKLKAAASRLIEGTQMLAASTVGLSLQLQEQVSDATDEIKRMQGKLENFVDAAGDEICSVIRSSIAELGRRSEPSARNSVRNCSS